MLAILVGGRTEHLALDATVPSSKIGAVAESPVAAAPLPIVQSIAGLPGRVTRVLIEPKPGREAALRRALTDRFGATLNARPVDTEAKLLGNAAGPEKQVTLLFSAISLVAGIILAYNALLLASDERRRFIVYLIETGTPDSMIVASLAFDALILGLAGSLLGLLAGDVISLIAYRTVPGYIAAAFAIGGQRVVGAADGPDRARRAACSRPSPRRPCRRSWLCARAPRPSPKRLVARSHSRASSVSRTRSSSPAEPCSSAVSVAASALMPATTVAALVGLAAGLVICLPMILRQLLKLARAASRRSGDPAARLAVAELRGSPTRRSRCSPRG